MPILTSSAHRGLLCMLVSVAGLAACVPRPAVRPSGPPFEAIWQRHEATINYFGLTALYSCDSFEEKVRTVLLYLGARPDIKVQQLGCNRDFDRPGHLTTVRADFYTLAPASSTAPGTLFAQWTPITIKPMNPYWMGFGECELMQQIRPVVTGDYSARDLHYQTACVPHEVTISDFDMSGEFPTPTAAR